MGTGGLVVVERACNSASAMMKNIKKEEYISIYTHRETHRERSKFCEGDPRLPKNSSRERYYTN